MAAIPPPFPHVCFSLTSAYAYSHQLSSFESFQQYRTKTAEKLNALALSIPLLPTRVQPDYTSPLLLLLPSLRVNFICSNSPRDQHLLLHLFTHRANLLVGILLHIQR
ncbi:hypothetical protein BU26DRAFT_516096 [Trematosphaeria pertusa]|uniref:Uncharacterized protein n=1 Tax=Trematosphaeria pertusa TaxID=390896 RepID=A0A6A6IV84_9PLEO|nr:uncharacterized protein BU26DRAFT_516096 [Trematosphaeria pertusa]KAF2253812.1 hypothetical protein BU26DRAFT_516096 [Trematosphaeria pertusa]